MEIPFFIGVVGNKKIDIFSGESIPHFFLSYGNPCLQQSRYFSKTNRISIQLAEISDRTRLFSIEGNNYNLLFPKIASLGFDENYLGMIDEISKIRFVSNLIQRNISNIKSKSSLLYYADSQLVEIYPCPDMLFPFDLVNKIAESFEYLKCENKKGNDIKLQFLGLTKTLQMLIATFGSTQCMNATIKCNELNAILIADLGNT